MDTDNTTTNTDDTNEVDAAIEEMPEAVEDFMWSDAFTLLMKGIQKELSLTDEQRETMKDGAQDLMLELKDMEQVYASLTASGMNSDTALKALYLIDREVIGRAENLAEIPSEAEDDDTEDDGAVTDTDTATVNAPSPADVLASLKARMTKPAAIAPTARQLSPDRELPPGPASAAAPAQTAPSSQPPTPPSSNAPAPAAPKKNKFDIYREQV